MLTSPAGTGGVTQNLAGRNGFAAPLRARCSRREPRFRTSLPTREVSTQHTPVWARSPGANGATVKEMVLETVMAMVQKMVIRFGPPPLSAAQVRALPQHSPAPREPR